MTERELLLSLLAKTLNKPNEELVELLYTKSADNIEALKPEALTTLLELEESRVGSLKGTQQKRLDDEYKRGMKETAIRFEKSFKKLTGFDSDLQGEELIQSGIEKLSESKGKVKLNDDEFRKDPRWMEYEKKLLTDAEEKVKVEKENFEKFKSTYEKTERLNKVKSEFAMKVFEELKPVLPDNPTVRNNQIEVFKSRFDNFDWEFIDGEPVPIKDGKRIENKLGHPVRFKDFAAEQVTSLFVLPASDSKTGAGNKTPEGTAKNITVPKNEEEYRKAIYLAKDAQERIALKTAYEASQKV